MSEDDNASYEEPANNTAAAAHPIPRQTAAPPPTPTPAKTIERAPPIPTSRPSPVANQRDNPGDAEWVEEPVPLPSPTSTSRWRQPERRPERDLNMH
jgi:hypothetical protein